YDFFVDTPRRRAPAAALDFHCVEADFGPTRQAFHIGLGAAAVPGAPAGLEAISAALGRVPLARTLEPAIRLARRGYRLRSIDAFVAGVVEPIVTASEPLRRTHCRPDGSLLRAGDRLVQPDLADSLERLAAEGAAPFYRGDLAARLVACCREFGGLLG